MVPQVLGVCTISLELIGMFYKEIMYWGSKMNKEEQHGG